jgi:adenylosuccinate synthase
LRTCRTWNDLPATAQTYLEFVADQTLTPVAVVSIGPDRSETIFARRDLIWG